MSKIICKEPHCLQQYFVSPVECDKGDNGPAQQFLCRDASLSLPLLPLLRMSTYVTFCNHQSKTCLRWSNFPVLPPDPFTGLPVVIHNITSNSLPCPISNLQINVWLHFSILVVSLKLLSLPTSSCSTGSSETRRV